MPASATSDSSAAFPTGRGLYIILAGLLVAAFAARLGVRVALGEDAFWTQGYTSFYRLAERIAATGAFCDGDRCPRPPLYPAFLALTALIAKNYLLIVVPQALIGAGTALMAFLIGREMFDARVGLIACALLMANNVRDIPTDTAAGKRTLAVRLGDRHARESYVLMLAVAILLVIVLAPTKPWMLIVLLLIPACLMPAWLMVNGKKRKSLIPVLKQTGLINLGYSLLFSLGLILNRGF